MQSSSRERALSSFEQRQSNSDTHSENDASSQVNIHIHIIAYSGHFAHKLFDYDARFCLVAGLRLLGGDVCASGWGSRIPVGFRLVMEEMC